ncbi:hypothetical protein HOM13_03675 [Candidatus Woesearchaeota archaeon]|jgi:hypothetical protein|nr:hypothetical protein [Candidatus Woesearchaeota archaeon]MBT5215808.1 hypothetical protein [Candidatus Woesearchaeota archaeon]
MKYSTRIEFLLDSGIFFNHSNPPQENAPNNSSLSVIAYFEEGGMEYLPLTNGKVQTKIVFPDREISRPTSLEFCLRNLLKKRGVSKFPKSFGSLIGIEHSIISPDGKDKWDFVMPTEEDILKYSQLR